MALVTHRFRQRSSEAIGALVSEIGALGLVIELGSSCSSVVDILVDDAHTDDLVESMDLRGWSFLGLAPTTFREREAQAALGLGVTQPGQVAYASTVAGLVLTVPVVTGDGFGVVTSDGFEVSAL